MLHNKMKKINKTYWTSAILILLVLAVLIALNFNSDNNMEKTINYESDNSDLKTLSDGTKYLINPDKIKSGGPPRGGIGVDRGIPALAEKNIKFVSVNESDKWIKDNELVLALTYNGVERVYPLQILVWHEIINDNVAGDPILITYCPLCGSGIAYERKIDLNGEKVETRFGTSGKLYNSNLVMYDKETDTYWQQIDGKAIVGTLTGQELKEISIDTVVWRDWKKTHKNSEVLSKDTGFSRQYGKDPYGNYYEDSFLLFDVDSQDDRIHPKTVVFGIEVNGIYKAYRENDLIAEKIINDKIGGINVRIEREDEGVVKITNLNTGEEIVKERDFWFAWYAFHPETKLYGFAEN
ncbi:hypothetical protein COY00_02260 [Candidatus Pacearchaeota archaeon CG_4_10_14_0_2_um_filter_35_33]|nr:MAG: hypothetical protein COY79_00735 [Candidatus Pacearchaeota archaeon CG_4_10_14_0_8_um_filter_35_169]PIZ80069.1 MAG: hypothetical protein COY00_02260 [Candidatus Pacearchaeota archaeon CG_4_10_14_0_2_um_filter_35_33]PJA69972.1 MAG: hypothetical protein CO155_02440 [Candidatus Pacearchaeota archaeon CG_4_9_14_3_um_filter_35_19]PJB94614.1 MAG: hypothetical protein CO081_00060 [Candidatus Pacearchaeota archaeon CG_4_9_14_0_8_um_filter_35_24]